MNAEEPTHGRRVIRRYSADDRERLVIEQAASGQTKKAFCEQRGINIGTFHGWRKRGAGVAKRATATFAQVDVPVQVPAAVEILMPNGVRVGIRHEGKQTELIALVRGVAGTA